MGSFVLVAGSPTPSWRLGGHLGDAPSGLSCSTDRTAGVIGVFGSASSAGSPRGLDPASLACAVGDLQIEATKGL